MPAATLPPRARASRAVPDPTPAPMSVQLGVILPRRMLSTEDLAEFFGVKQITIREWAKRGLIPRGKKYGKFLRWRPDEIAPYLTAE